MTMMPVVAMMPVMAAIFHVIGIGKGSLGIAVIHLAAGGGYFMQITPLVDRDGFTWGYCITGADGG